MKTNKRLFLLLLSLVVSVSALYAQSKKEKKEEKEKAVKEVVESGNFKIDVSRAYPQGGRSVQLSPSYSLELRNDSVFSNLPYYGRAYSIPYGGGDGLRFNAPLETYKMETKKNNAIKITFITRSKEDRFDFFIQIFPNGTAAIDVSMQQRQSISFSGELILPL
ncbi:MAG: DUF4251 domain-containing protein [Bacteroides sp.]|uniref:DUF4251 domain-containing protein n=1 Tax=Bacteroides sp. TaxID=29523 RepID=UPI002FC7B7C7